MSRRPPTPALLAGALLAGGLLAGCGDDEVPETTGAGARVAPSQLSVASGVPDDAQPVQVVSAVVSGGRVSGDTGRVPVRLGSRVRLAVVSDTADDLVVEGYGLSQVAAAGRATQLELVADRAGEFAVRLDEAGVLVTTLVVA